MSRGQDGQKLREWQGRLERFRVGGQTVSRFCAKEGVAVHCFYYWARRVRSHRSGVIRHRLDDPQDETARRAGAAALPVAGIAMVQFRLNAAVEVSVPAHCLEVIRCLAQCVQDARPVRGDAFREVVVSSR